MIFDKIKKIPVGVKSAGAYTMASLFSKGLAIITVPIFTRIMTTAEIGTVNLYNTWHSLLHVIVTLALTLGGCSAALKHFDKERDQYLSSTLTLTTLMGLLVGVIYFIAPSFWNNLTGLSTELMVLLIIGFCLTPAQEFWLVRQRFEYKYKFVCALTMGSALFASVVSVVTVLSIHESGYENVAEGRLFANNAVMFTVAAVLWVYIMVKGKTFVNTKYWKFALALSIPLMGHALASEVLQVSDRIMIANMVGESAVGIYSTLYTVSSISLMVWSAINSSFVPYLFQNIDKEGNKIKQISLMLMGAYALVAIVLTFFAPEIVKILATEEYYEAIYIMPPIAGGVFLTSVSHMYANILTYYKKTVYIMYSSAIAAVINVILNYFCIKEFGYMAAAYTTLVAYIFLAGSQMFFSMKVQKESGKSIYNNKAVVLVAFATIMLALSGLFLYQHTVIRYVLIIIGTIIGIMVALKAFKMKNNAR